MTSSIPLHRYDATACIISMQRPVRSGSRAQLLNPLRISHPKIDKLACQTQGVDIFAKAKYLFMMRTVYIFLMCSILHCVCYYTTQKGIFQDVIDILCKNIYSLSYCISSSTMYGRFSGVARLSHSFLKKEIALPTSANRSLVLA